MSDGLRRWRASIALACVAAALAAWLWVDPPSPGAPSESEGALCPGLDEAAIVDLRLTRGGVTAHLTRREDGWWLDGRLGRADGAVVEGILSALAYARVERRPAVDRKLAGLDPPLATAQAGACVVSVGARDSLGAGVYAARQGEGGVVLTDRRLAAALDVPPDGLRAAALIDRLEGARSIHVGGARLARRGAGWVVEDGGEAVRADPDQAGALLRALAEARASRFADGDSPAALSIVVDGVERARMGGACPGHVDERYVRRGDGAGLCISGAIGRALDGATAASLRSLSPAPVLVDGIRSLTLVSSGRALAVERAGDGWRIVTPSAAAADESSVEGLIAALASVRGRRILPTDRVTPSAGGARLEIVAEDGDRLTAAVVGRAGADLVVRRDAEPALLAVPATFAALLDPDPARVAEPSFDAPDGGPARPLD